MTAVIVRVAAGWHPGRMKRSLLLLAMLLSLVTGALAATAERWTLAEAPPDVKPAAERAVQGFGALAKTLQGRLGQAMGEGGPVQALWVCRVEAPKLTAAVAREKDMALGRTSTRLRNPANEPRAWVRPYLEKWAGRPAAEAPVEIVDLGQGRVGVISPIAAGALCLTCHGTNLSSPLRSALKEAYPRDQATGFRAGDLRGVFWAELSR